MATERAATVPASTPRRSPRELEDATAEEALRWALDTFHPRLYIACLVPEDELGDVHMATQINPDARFFYLDTDVLFPETYETRERARGALRDQLPQLQLDHARAAGRPLRRRALEPRPRRLLRHPQGRADALGAVGRRLLGLAASAARTRRRRAKRAQVRLGQALRPLEAEPARRLDREGRLALPRTSTTSPTTRCTTRATPRSAAPTAPASRPRARTRAPAAGPGTSKTECGLHG